MTASRVVDDLLVAAGVATALCLLGWDCWPSNFTQLCVALFGHDVLRHAEP